MKYKNIGDFIKLRRKELGFTQSDLALELSITRENISKWERGISIPNTEYLEKLSKILNTPIDEMLNSKKNNNRYFLLILILFFVSLFILWFSSPIVYDILIDNEKNSINGGTISKSFNSMIINVNEISNFDDLESVSFYCKDEKLFKVDFVPFSFRTKWCTDLFVLIDDGKDIIKNKILLQKVSKLKSEKFIENDSYKSAILDSDYDVFYIENQKWLKVTSADDEWIYSFYFQPIIKYSYKGEKKSIYNIKTNECLLNDCNKYKDKIDFFLSNYKALIEM